MREWRLTHPLTDRQRQRDNARSYAAVYLRRSGRARLPCEVCGAPDAEMHHPDYAQPTVIVWLCRQHHRGHHAVPYEDLPTYDLRSWLP